MDLLLVKVHLSDDLFEGAVLLFFQGLSKIWKRDQRKHLEDKHASNLVNQQNDTNV